MGADLYRKGIGDIRARHKAAFNEALRIRNTTYPNGCPDDAPEAQAVLDAWDAMYPDSHYFRDSYNNSSLLWKLDLSWCRDAPRPRTCSDDDDDPCAIEPDQLREFAQTIRSRSELLGYNIRNEPDENKTYFLEKYDRLIRFLEDAANAGDWVRFSV
jgi:hypothetical protein